MTHVQVGILYNRNGSKLYSLQPVSLSNTIHFSKNIGKVLIRK